MGDLTVRLEPGDATSARIGVAFPGLEGDVDIVQAGGLIDVDTSGFALRPSPERVADLLCCRGGHPRAE